MGRHLSVGACRYNMMQFAERDRRQAGLELGLIDAWDGILLSSKVELIKISVLLCHVRILRAASETGAPDAWSGR